MGEALITDLYELNMAVSYLRREMVGPATFSLFVRRLPSTRGFFVAAGLEDCLSYLESFHFSEEDLQWLARSGYSQGDVARLGELSFTGEVHAVAEGRVLFENEPILEVTAPIAEAQLVETFLLNQLTFQSTIATKAARCTLAVGDMELFDFALRRTQGPEAGMSVARLSALAGFVGTSNVEAARRYGLRAAGTMAHSYIEAFPSEVEAFRAFAEDLPQATTFLVDTYDTLGGVQAAIKVIGELDLAGPLGVRLDSGDLSSLARDTRVLLDDAGLSHVRIFVSGSLDEYELERLVGEGAPIDAAGVGTRMGVSADAPYLDSAYKLVAFGDRPILKLSADKTNLAGPKQIWRRSPIEGDLLTTRDEVAPPGYEPLLQPVMREGRRIAPPDTLDKARQRLVSDLAALPRAVRDLHHPEPGNVEVSERLALLTEQATALVRGGLD